jgi:hypothetical protein
MHMMSWTEYPLISIVAVIVLALLVLYLTRMQAHAVIRRAAKMFHRLFRLTARACLRAEQRLRFRNHEVTKALAEALMERQLERRFLRIEVLVEKDLANYQKLSAEINRQLVSIDEDYQASAEVPAAAPEWVDAVDALASLQNGERGSDVMNKILADLHKTVQQHQREVMREHRWTVSARHKVLSGLRPKWRRLGKMLAQIDHNIEGLRLRLHQVDQHMGQFELLTAGTRLGLMGSMFMRFSIALCFVAIGVAAAMINMQLLNKPLTHLLTLGQLGELPVVSLVAMAHIAITLMAATMVTESMRVTHLFPLMSAMTRRGRSIITAMGGFLLITMAGIEAAALATVPVIELAEVNVVSQLVLAALGLVMPMVLALAVIPLEYLLCTVRPVVGSVIQLMLHVSALALRLMGAAMLELGKLVVLGYDVLIFIPLGCESLWHNQRLRREQANAATEDEGADTPDGNVSVPNVTALRFGSSGRIDKK